MERYKEKPKQKFKQQSQLKIKPQQKLKQELKQKIIIYQNNGKFFISDYAAYAMGLTNTRSIMLDEPRFFEISIDTLNRFKNNKLLDIEYQNLKINYEEKNITSDLEPSFYGIGISGIYDGDKIAKAKNILNTGLNLTNNAKSILSNIISLGINDLDFNYEVLKNYQYGYGMKVNIIIAVPLYIENSKEERIYLGFPKENYKTRGNQYFDTCLLDRICSNLKQIPKEFILGYIVDNEFVSNSYFYDNLNEENKNLFFQKIKEHMDDITLTINKWIEENDIVNLEKMKNKLIELNIKPDIILSSLDIIKKVSKQKRKIILTNEEKDNITINKRKTRRIILENMLDDLQSLKDEQDVIKK